MCRTQASLMKKMEEKMLAEQRRNVLNEQLKAIKKVCVSTLIKYIFINETLVLPLYGLCMIVLLLIDVLFFIFWEFFFSVS